MHTRTARRWFRLQKQTFSIWRPYWISRLAIIYANLCRQFQKLQRMKNILVYDTSCCTGVGVGGAGVRVHNFSVLKVTLPFTIWTTLWENVPSNECHYEDSNQHAHRHNLISLRYSYDETLRPQLFKMRRVQILIRIRKCLNAWSVHKKTCMRHYMSTY